MTLCNGTCGVKKIFQKHWFSKNLISLRKKIQTRNESIFKHFRAHCVPAILDSLSFRRFFWIWWWRHRKNITYNTSIYLLTEQEEPRDFAPKRWCRESSSSRRRRRKGRGLLRESGLYFILAWRLSASYLLCCSVFAGHPSTVLKAKVRKNTHLDFYSKCV